MTDRILRCLLGGPLLAASYRNNLLNSHDQRRIEHAPQLAELTDWKVSRALKQLADSPVVSLSHSKGFAALLCTDYPIPAGVDLEAVRPRDFRSLSEWVCTAEEQEYLCHHNWQAEIFYRLWCTKEALLKAAGLNFPADMANVGYRFYGNEVGGLRVPHQNSWHGITARLTPDFTLACVWRGEDVRINWLFYGDLNVDSLGKLEAV